ncbi:MAG: hypothetical protein ABEK00_02245, partial [Candidatus Nanohaloarchaea archaeon]
MQVTKKKRRGSIKSLEIAALIFTIPLFISAVLITVLMTFMLDLSIVQQYPFPVKLAKTVISYSKYLDGVVLLAWTAIVGKIMLRSFRTNMHPIYGVLGLLSLPGLTIVLGQASNVVAVFTQLDLVSQAVNKFPGSFYLLKNLPLIGVTLAILILIVMV